tara:strand:- start:10007 stop:10915 length:909 start_codon:yes stop_codon:yes gene_type:complete
MTTLLAADLFDHPRLIETYAEPMKAWLQEMGQIADHYENKDAVDRLEAACNAHGIQVRKENRDRAWVLVMDQHGLEKDVVTISVPTDATGMAQLSRGFHRSAFEFDLQSGEKLDMPLLMRNGYNEYAFAIDMSQRDGQRVIAFEDLALSVLASIHPDDLKLACEDEGYVPSMRDELMTDRENVRHNDLLAQTLEIRDIEIAGPAGPNSGGIEISKRLGMVFIKPYEMKSITIIGSNIIINNQDVPDSMIIGRKVREIIDMPLPLGDLAISSHERSKLSLTFETNGYEDGISKARFFDLKEKQ